MIVVIARRDSYYQLAEAKLADAAEVSELKQRARENTEAMLRHVQFPLHHRNLPRRQRIALVIR